MSNEFAREPYINLVTFRRNGDGIPTPVWVAGVDGKLYIFTDGTSAKVKRIRATGKIRIAACDARGKVRGPWHDGHARIVTEPDLVDRAYAALREKYGWQMTLVDGVSWIAGRIGRRAIIEVEVDA